MFSFCAALTECVVVYGNTVKSDHVTSLRFISTQASSLRSAAEVMIQQCISRSQTLEEDDHVMNVKELNQSGATLKQEQKVPIIIATLIISSYCHVHTSLQNM